MAICICYRNRYNFTMRSSLADGTKERIAFGATGEAIRDVFDIAAGDDRAIVEEQGSAHLEL